MEVVKIKRLKQFIENNDVDILMFLGIFCITYASFLFSDILGFYVMGTTFIALSLFLLKFPRR